LRHVTVVSGAVGLLCALYLVVHPTFAASLAEEKAESGLAE
jgi:hypothetical protein